MNIKYEKNSRVNKALKAGTILDDEVIQKTKTSEFPADTATVRLHRLQDQYPRAVIHVKGEGKERKYTAWDGSVHTYVSAPTLRVHIDSQNDMLEFSGNCPIKNIEILQELVDEVKRKLSL